MKWKQNRVFITGIGTGVGKTVSSACITQALKAQYWKPVQAGLEEGTDTAFVAQMIQHPAKTLREVYRLKTPASPHLAARIDGVAIDLEHLVHRANALENTHQPMVIEGAGGLMVPLNEHQFILDLIIALEARVILVAGNYLGSINHSLLTAKVLQENKIPVLGWIFSGEYNTNEDDIVSWSNIPKIGRIPKATILDQAFIQAQAIQLENSLKDAIDNI
ncbi:dethiobiotin synthase [Chitinophaga caeni]|uniref:ATP-dependent dethiobiotin synthetase BioD n=1 Tax=Chitinophaga caeni TaxID=2029983 RepID=A0A291QXE5_9BACT|nr:dethiobiotin synthase [Chitinophaga caeni]ATL48534.1 dethiobiotin synthase [Chitinophaga caeni]